MEITWKLKKKFSSVENKAMVVNYSEKLIFKYINSLNDILKSDWLLGRILSNHQI